MVESLRPKSLAEALAYRAETGALPFAGGTDLMVRHRGYTGTGPNIGGPVLFLDAVEELRSVEMGEESVRIGAAATLTEILAVKGMPELIIKAVELIAAPGLRNRATMAGNVCNASPAGDSIPPLYVHEASVLLKSATGERRLPIDQFLTGPGKTALGDDEILAGFEIPLLPEQPEGLCYYRKVGTRKANALSKLSTVGYARIDGGMIQDFRFAVGAVAPTVVRLPEAEKLLRGTKIGAIQREAVLEAAAEPIRPIDDQRSTAAYRKQVALNALNEFLDQMEEK